ncbi:hypothetical protein KIV45_08370 [Janthinobacterium lividum]|nr:hypothetical protein KIV45_08370 [Janthinobacterium lividum]
MRATVAAPSRLSADLTKNSQHSGAPRRPDRSMSMVIGMLPRSGISQEQDLVAKVRAMATRNGNKIAVMSSANIKNGDFITVI